MHAVKTRAGDDEELTHLLSVFGLVPIAAIDIALPTGRRPADVLKFQCVDIRDGAL